MTCKVEEVTVSPVRTPLTIDTVQIDQIISDLFVTDVIVNKIGCQDDKL